MSFKPFVASMLLVSALSAGSLRAGAQAMDGMQMHRAPAAPSTSLTVTIDGKATTFSVADLNAMPQKTVTVHNEHTKLDESYTGVLLSELLVRCGFTDDQAHHRQLLRSYVVAGGTDKYWVLYSAVEVEGSDHAADVVVATAMNGKDLGTDGRLKLIATGDKKPARWVRNLSAITLKASE